MKIIVNQEALNKAIGVVQKAVPSRVTMPILKGILFTAKDKQLTLVANDMQIGIETSIECHVEEEGSIVIDSKLIGDIVRHIKDEVIHLVVEDNLSIHMNSVDLDISIKGYDTMEFPELPEIKTPKKILIKEKILLDMIHKTIFAAADTDYMHIINGILFEIRKNELVVAATDGRRFAIRKQKITNDDLEARFVIPGSSLKEIRKLLSLESDKSIEVLMADNHVSFMINQVKIVTRLLQGEFIKYGAIIPKDFLTHVKVDTIRLLSALDINSVLAEKVNSAVILNIESDYIEVMSQSEIGNISKKVKASVKGGPLQIAFNIRFLIDGIKAVDEKVINLLFVKGSRSPLVIKSRDLESYQYLLSPVLVSDIN